MASDLPDECWECIFRFIINDGIHKNNNRRNLSSLSTVSKRFLSITGRLRFSVTLVNPTLPFLRSLFKRFTHLNSLNLSRYLGHNLDDLLCQISRFPSLKITSLKLPNVGNHFPANGLRAFSQNITTLTSFTCSGFVNLLLIAKCFPLLEELDVDLTLKYPLHYFSMIETQTHRYNNGVEAISLSLLKLRKVNLSSFPINNQSLFHLFSNCKFLQEVNINGYKQLLTDAGIASALRERPTLMSFSLSSFSISRPSLMTSHIIDSLVSFKGLTCLGLYLFNISDEFLYTIARGGLPLTKLVLESCFGYSYDGLFCLLSKCRQGFQHLYLGPSKFLNDQHVIQLSSFLGDLMSINLSNCDKLTESSLFALARNCPLLGEITMEHIGGKSGENYDSLMKFGLHPQLKSLNLCDNSWLRDENIIRFASIFPNLEVLNLDCCKRISKGICQVLRKCCKIRDLKLSNCSRLKPLGINFVVPELEVLDLSGTMVDDETLYVILKNCCGLLQLILKRCYNVREKGVKHVLENCTQLREFHLDGFHANDKNRELFARRGCLLCYAEV